MKSIANGCACALFVILCAPAAAQEHGGASVALDSEKQPVRVGGVPLEQVLAVFAKKSGKKLIVDNRVSGNVEILGQEIATITYADLLALLLLNGYTAVETGNYVSVIPVNSVRAEPLPLVTGNNSFPDAQFVTAVIPVKFLTAPSLVPILRPLLPTYGHLAASVCGNSLIVVDNYANVKRMEKLVATLDTGKTPYVSQSCDGDAHAPTGGSK